MLGSSDDSVTPAGSARHARPQRQGSSTPARRKRRARRRPDSFDNATLAAHLQHEEYDGDVNDPSQEVARTARRQLNLADARRQLNLPTARTRRKLSPRDDEDDVDVPGLVDNSSDDEPVWGDVDIPGLLDNSSDDEPARTGGSSEDEHDSSFEPGPEFQPGYDGSDPLRSPGGRAQAEADFFVERECHYDRLQAHLDSTARVCWKCNEAWIRKGPHHKGIDGKWACAGCHRLLEKGERVHGDWCSPVLYRQVAPSLPQLNRAELQICSPICPSISVVSLTARQGAARLPLMKKYKRRLTLCMRKTLDYLAVTVPRKVGDLDVFILRIVGLSDEDMRKIAGWQVSRGKMAVFLRHMREHNAEWREKMSSGFLKWDDEAEAALPDGVVPVPLVTEAAAGGLGRQADPGDDPVAHAVQDGFDPDEEEPMMMSHPEAVAAVANVREKTIRQRLLEVVDGPQLDDDSPCPSRDLPGIEALMFPDLFADGCGTFAGVQRPGERPHKHCLEWCQHIFKLMGAEHAAPRRDASHPHRPEAHPSRDGVHEHRAG